MKYNNWSFLIDFKIVWVDEYNIWHIGILRITLPTINNTQYELSKVVSVKIKINNTFIEQENKV